MDIYVEQTRQEVNWNNSRNTTNKCINIKIIFLPAIFHVSIYLYHLQGATETCIQHMVCIIIIIIISVKVIFKVIQKIREQHTRKT